MSSTTLNIYDYLKYILKPDMNNRLLKIYHISSKAISPLAVSSLFTHYYLPDYENSIHALNIINMSYHSYFSTSSIITDYIKPPRISQFVRASSFNLHFVASVGLFQYLYQEKNSTCKK